jgi:anti-sigma factor RsiW
MSSMNQDPLDLREKAWRGALSKAEQAQLDAWLASHPEARAEWAADMSLKAALARLPEKPAPSNLTARVLAEIDREDLATAGARNTKTNFFGLGSWGWVTRTAVVVAVLGLGVLGYQHHQKVEHVKTAQNLVAAVRTVPPLPPELLENFDLISSLPPPFPGADMELLSVMK